MMNLFSTKSTKFLFAPVSKRRSYLKVVTESRKMALLPSCIRKVRKNTHIQTPQNTQCENWVGISMHTDSVTDKQKNTKNLIFY